MTEQGPAEPVGAAALVIRVWREPADVGLRARISRRDDLDVDAETSVVVASADDVYREVRDWLEGFLQRSAPER
ncbi:hypothetical protein [Kribbella sp. NPDC048915]|uniref:hypothetical protein n=1 Tax=Kribbella sp. NPDC048915 TaxID=3155148 RepID=UPI0033C4EEBA